MGNRHWHVLFGSLRPVIVPLVALVALVAVVALGATTALTSSTPAATLAPQPALAEASGAPPAVERLAVAGPRASAGLATFLFQGRVYEGDTGIETAPLAGVTVGLYCANGAYPSPGNLLQAGTTDATGWYGLIASGICEFYHILETDPLGYTSVGARSVGGTVMTSNWIEFAYSPSFSSTILTGNKFWDRSATTATPTPPPSATATGTQPPTRTATATPPPSATATGTQPPTRTATPTPPPSATVTGTQPPTRSATATPPPSATVTGTQPPTRTATPPVTGTPPATGTPTGTATPTATPSVAPRRLIVNATADHDDGSCDHPRTETLDCTLREAMREANEHGGPDLILFDIPTWDTGYEGGIWVIEPQSALPTLTDDGTTVDGSGVAPDAARAGKAVNAGPTCSCTQSTIKMTGSNAYFAISSSLNWVTHFWIQASTAATNYPDAVSIYSANATSNNIYCNTIERSSLTCLLRESGN